LKLRQIFLLLIVGFTIYSIITLLSQVKFSEVKVLLDSLDDRWPLYLLFSVVANLMATLAWILLDHSGELKKIPLWELFIVRQAGESLGQLNPTGVIGGDYFKYKILQNKIDPSTVSTPLFLFRMYSIVSFFWIVALSFAAYIIFYVEKMLLPHFIILGILIPLIIFQFRILKELPSVVHFILTLLQRYVGLKPLIVEKFGVFAQQIASLNFSTKHLIPNILLILHWIIGSLEVYGIMQMLQVDIPPLSCIIMEYGIMAFKTAGQVIPAQLGIEEVGNSYMLLLFGGFTSAVWLGFSVMRRIRQLFWIFLSLLYVWCFQKKYGTLINLKK
jgi:hypothetical protein